MKLSCTRPLAALAAALLVASACGTADGPLLRGYTVGERSSGQSTAAGVRVLDSPAPPEVAPVAVPLSEVPVPQRPTAEGAELATLRVPSWGDDYEMPISEGISQQVLDTMGMGRFPLSELPGEEGNFAVAGHRTDGSQPLARIDELEIDDELVVGTDQGSYTYTVSGTEIVTPDQVRVVEPDPATGAQEPTGQLLTLVSCHPRGSNEFRYIVYAELAAFDDH